MVFRVSIDWVLSVVSAESNHQDTKTPRRMDLLVSWCFAGQSELDCERRVAVVTGRISLQGGRCMDPFRDRVAVITGGAGGIGMAMARAFAGRGAKLVLADLDQAALDRAVAELTGEGASALGV